MNFRSSQVSKISLSLKILEGYGYWIEAECEVYVEMVAFRNMISHQYLSIDEKIVYDILQNRLEDIIEFGQKIVNKI